MWATDEKIKLISQLEMESSEPMLMNRMKSIKSIEQRVVVLCLATWYFGYVFTETSLFPNAVWSHSFGPDMVKELYVGPCFGLIPFGAAFGLIIAHFTMDKVSRKTYLMIINMLTLTFTMCLQFGGIPVLFVFRFLQGVMAGIFMHFIPAYITDLTPKEYGSRFGVYPQIAVVLGVLSSYVVAMAMINGFDFENLNPTDLIDNKSSSIFWRVMLFLGGVPSIIQLFLLFIGYIPESPHSLILKNKRAEAGEVLSLFYEDGYVNIILDERERSVFSQTGNTFGDKIHWTPKGYYIGFQLAIFQVLTGVASYVTQTGHVIVVSLNSTLFGIYTPILITLGQLVGTFISIPMLKHIEWKSLTLVGGFSLAIFNGLIGMFLYLYKQDEDFQSVGLTFTVVCILAFMFTFGSTVGSSAWPYASYMMPSGAMLGAQVLNWLLAAGSIVAFSVNENATHTPYIIVWVYAGVTFAFSILNWIFMIDIKNLTVVEVQQKLA